VINLYEILNNGKNEAVSSTNPFPVKMIGGSTVFGSIKPLNYLYVGKNGNDASGDGSAGNPFLTVGAAMSIATAGTTVNTFPGTYTENLTFKAGVNLTCPVEYGVYIVGNHTANFSGTVICENIVLQNANSAASGTVLTVSGSSVINLQFLNSYINSFSTSGAGDSIQWTNTNASSKLQLVDGNVSVTTSGATARCFYSTTGAAGSVIANRVTLKLDNAANIALSIGGAIAFTHTQDSVTGQTVVANTASYIGTLVLQTATGVATFTTTSSGISVLSAVSINTNTSPAIAGTGGITFTNIMYLSTGVGGAATLNSGIGASPLTMGPLRIRAATLLPAAAVASGALTGAIEFDGTNFYKTIGTTRSVMG
jgi:hypothetical protein